ncbi:beta-lactamase/transpeptidase-like protein [Mytilinidion resinicola]|uniref:Beta-lactamase/transpeptidase-like protein n=1 Tax=Mytilinidion resinicola TaxID=574789 RepID=A0A6A6YAM0_9PEZI|nr:beta-lactamase/transpeptidase-like protein [Mytilinidion resinicola]KAF2805750.1 beta-lactamase/transpeptidase-like protein [Mytilinidion resinicola]
MEDVTTIKHRLSAVRDAIVSIMSIGGAPGAAIAVIHEGQTVYSDYLGFRDIANSIPVDEETIFPCASMTQAVVSAAVGICLEEEKFGWDTPVKDILPKFHTRDETLHHQMTPVDLVSHRAGMQSSLCWLGNINNVLIANKNSMNFINDLQRVKQFRGEYLYNNLGYEAAAHVLAKATNGNGKTCIKDLVKLYTVFLDAGADQFATGLTATPGSPLNQLPRLWLANISMNPISRHETSYAVG